MNTDQQLTELIAKCEQMLTSCSLCPRKCGVNRLKGETGYCGVDSNALCFKEMINNFDESELVPSYQVYFSGCNLKCAYCNVVEWNDEPMSGRMIKEEELINKITRNIQAGAKNLNFLGGEPTVNILGILRLLKKITQPLTVVWNSNMYFSDEAFSLLDGFVDIYLSDFKCGCDSCCSRILGAKDYLATVKANVLRAYSTTDIILRHIMLPEHFDCCTKPIIDWVASSVPNIKLSLRDNYVPPYSKTQAPSGYVNQSEFRKAIDYANSKGLRLVT